MINTKTLFAALVKASQADCLCDIGSRDGMQSLLLHDLRPAAQVLAFEANPENFQRMEADPRLKEAGIHMYPYAIAEERAQKEFYLADIDVNDPEANIGTSSLFRRPHDQIKAAIKVEAHRIDDFILGQFPNSKRICLWIDVEGAEYFVLQGAARIASKLYAVHVETAFVPMVVNHRLYPELEALLKTYGLVPSGKQATSDGIWGDAVFVREELKTSMGFQYYLAQFKAVFSRVANVDGIAVFLKARSPNLYKTARRLYLKFT